MSAPNPIVIRVIRFQIHFSEGQSANTRFLSTLGMGEANLPPYKAPCSKVEGQGSLFHICPLKGCGVCGGNVLH